MKMPVLDKNFYPMIKALNDFDAVVKQNANPVEVTIVAERSGGYNYVYTYNALPDGVNDKLNFRVAERIAKTILEIMECTGPDLICSKEAPADLHIPIAE